MKIRFYNGWLGSSMKRGESFPIEFCSLYVDINPGFGFMTITILNFSMEISFRRD